MLKKLDLEKVEQRVHHAAYQDGLLEIFLGGYLLFVGGTLATNSKLTPFTALLIFLLNPLFERAKNRYIYPRIGYVKLRDAKGSDPKGVVYGAIVFVVVLLAAIGLFILLMGKERGSSFWLSYFVPGLSGLMMAIGPFWLGQTFGLKRAYVLAALCLLGGILIPVLGIATGYAAVGLQCSLVGLVSLISGIITFTRFLRKYPLEDVADAAN